MQALTGFHSRPPSPCASARTTVHAPQSPSAQPSLVPVRPQVVAQVLEQRRLRRNAADPHDLAVEEEADLLVWGPIRRIGVIAHQE